MLTKFFYLIVVPSVLAFFIGYVAHGLKTMTTTAGKMNPGSNEDQNDSGNNDSDQGPDTNADGPPATALV